MLNNISRNMKIINKDILETAWLKCLIDDVPKEKHLAIVQKCLSGQMPKISADAAIRKIQRELQYPQKSVNALKSFYLVHIFKRYLATVVSSKTLDHSLDKGAGEQLLHTTALGYLRYLLCQEQYDQIDCAFKMYRILELLLTKLNLPILELITKKLLLDLVKIYSKINKVEDDEYEEYSKYVRATKQLKRFLDLKVYVKLSNEELEAIKSVKLMEFKIKKNPEFKINTQNVPQPLIQSLFEPIHQKQPVEQKCESERKFSMESGRRCRFITPNTMRATSIQNTFYIQKQSPLNFLIQN